MNWIPSLGRFLELPLLLALAAGFLPTAAQAEAATPPHIVGLRVGFKGHYRVGVWTPVQLTLRAGDQPLSGQLEILVDDDDGIPTRVVAPPQQLSPGKDSSVTVFARFGR